jgi:hypothetical protein
VEKQGGAMTIQRAAKTTKLRKDGDSVSESLVEVPTPLTLESLTELVLASITQMTEDERRVLREALRWDFYERKLRPDAVN